MVKCFLAMMAICSNIFAQEERMEFYKIGEGTPKIAVIAGIHGDELAGISLVREILAENSEIEGTILLIPEGNREAVKEKVRTPYYMEDLNRAFPGNSENLTGKIARDIFNMIHEEKIDFIIDIHESYYRYSDGKDPRFYIGDSIIVSEKVFENHPELLLQMKFPLLNSPSRGSLIFEADEKLGIPGMIVELCREDSLEVRVDKGREILEKVLEYFEIY